MDAIIAPLTKKTEDAVRIAVESNTGKDKDVRPRLKEYKRYFIAIDKSRVVGEIGWYQDEGEFAGNLLLRLRLPIF